MSGMTIHDLNLKMGIDYAKGRVASKRQNRAPSATNSSNPDKATKDPAFKLNISLEAKELSRQALEKSGVDREKKGIEFKVEDIDTSSSLDVATTVTKGGNSLTFRQGINRKNKPFVLIDVVTNKGDEFLVTVDEDTIINESKDGTLSFSSFSGLSGGEDDIIIDFSGEVDSGAGDDFIVSVAAEGNLRRDGRAYIDAGAGDDVVYSLSNAKNSTILGGSGDDYINVNAGGERLNVEGGAGSDIVFANSSGKKVVVQGNEGDDSLDVETTAGAAVHIKAGDGNDGIHIDRKEDSSQTIGMTKVEGGAGRDVIRINRIGSQSNLDNDTLGGEVDGGEGADSIHIGKAYNTRVVKDQEDEVVITEEKMSPEFEAAEKERERKELEIEIAKIEDAIKERAEAARNAMLNNANDISAKMAVAGSNGQQNAAASKELLSNSNSNQDSADSKAE